MSAVTATPSPPRGPRLTTIPQVRREMVKIYFEVRAGMLAGGEGTKLVYILQSIGKLLETADVEARLEALERTIADLSGNVHLR